MIDVWDPHEEEKRARAWTIWGASIICLSLVILVGAFLILGSLVAPARPLSLKEVLNLRSIGTREITAYNAVVAQCDADPDWGAYGRVADNGRPLGHFFACNWLPKNTKIIIPSLTGDIIWTCRDRTSEKVRHRIDLLYPVGKSIGLRKAEVFIYVEKK